MKYILVLILFLGFMIPGAMGLDKCKKGEEFIIMYDGWIANDYVDAKNREVYIGDEYVKIRDAGMSKETVFFAPLEKVISVLKRCK